MPAYGIGSIIHEVLGAFVSCSSVHKVDFGKAFRAATSKVNVWPAKIFCPVYCFLDRQVRKILAVENDKFPLSNKKS